MNRLVQMFTDKHAPEPRTVTIFPQKSDRSSAGVCEFDTTEEATDALVICNHTPVDSPGSAVFVPSLTQSPLRFSVGKAPYIVKLAFAGGRDGKDFRP